MKVKIEKVVKMQLRIQMVIVFIVLLSMLMISMTTAQTTAGFTQQAYALSKIMPSVKTIGIISSKVTDSFFQSTTRAGFSNGIKVIVAKVHSPREIPELYHTLLKDGAKMIWLPDKDDDMVLEKGFEYLRENTLEDKIGLCVPLSKMVLEGAFCSIQIEGKNLTVQINKRVAQVIGAAIVDDPSSSVKYVLK
jgi:ABC-type uncharacterized transport system substrate-binding protein